MISAQKIQGVTACLVDVLTQQGEAAVFLRGEFSKSQSTRQDVCGTSIVCVP
jgi:hypothetical protein